MASLTPISLPLSGCYNVAMDHSLLRPLLRAAFAVALLCTPSPAQEIKLHAANHAANDLFGSAVSVSGNVAIVGARYHDHNGIHKGAAYLYNATTGVQTTALLAPDGADYDYFGCSVGVNGDNAIVGARLDDDNGPQSGSAYIYDVTTGILKTKLLPVDGAEGDAFGHSVAISGDTAIVGVYMDSGVGAAYLFDINTGVQLAKLTPFDGLNNDYFGSSVAISATTAVVGSKEHDHFGQASGAVYIFDLITGDQSQKITPSDGAAHDNFGCSVGISGDTVLIGADSNSETGAAYIFDLVSGEETKLVASDGASGDKFGAAVSIREGTGLVVGAPWNNQSGAGSGAAYVYNAAGTQLFKLLSTDGAAGDEFGSAVSLSGTAALIGAMRHDFDSLEDSGTAYLMAPLDCNSNGFADSYDISNGSSLDCNLNGIPDECQIDGNDCNSDGVPDACETDCDNDGIPDSCQSFNQFEDCNDNGIPDSCDISEATESDSDEDGVPDSCQESDSDGGSSGGGCGIIPVSGGPTGKDFFEHYAGLLLLLILIPRLNRAQRAQTNRC
jgi:hypothetical protein